MFGRLLKIFKNEVLLAYSKRACANFGKRTRKNAQVRVRIGNWQNAHVRAMFVRPKIECVNVRACEAKIYRNSQFDIFSQNQFSTDAVYKTVDSRKITTKNRKSQLKELI